MCLSIKRHGDSARDASAQGTPIRPHSGARRLLGRLRVGFKSCRPRPLRAPHKKGTLLTANALFPPFVSLLGRFVRNLERIQAEFVGGTP